MEHGASPRQRTAILLFTLIVHLLLFVLLQRQAAWQPPPKEERRLVFPLTPEAPTKVRPVKRTAPGGKARPIRIPAPHVPPPPIPEPPVTPSPSFVILSKDAFASADIGKFAKRPGPSGADSGTGKAYGPSDGPGGVELVNADWYRKPTDAELAFFLPARAPSGFGMIACQTAPKYHVENCRVIDQTPGLGLGQAVRRAAWQFLVIPPRLNGQPQIGAWVRIRIDYNRVTTRNGPPIPYPLPPPDKPED